MVLNTIIITNLKNIKVMETKNVKVYQSYNATLVTEVVVPADYSEEDVIYAFDNDPNLDAIESWMENEEYGNDYEVEGI